MLARGREIERGTAVAVWAASSQGGAGAATFNAFHAVARSDRGHRAGRPAGRPRSQRGDHDPRPLLLPRRPRARADRRGPRRASRSSAGSPAPAHSTAGGALRGDAVAGDGAVGVVLRGVDVLPCVSQGAAPIGPELIVTAADGHVIRELDGLPASTALRAAIEELDARRARAVGGGLLLGISIGRAGRRSGEPDYLVRGIIGADPSGGHDRRRRTRPPRDSSCASTRATHASADRDLREALELRREALGGHAAGALVFTCNGRGRAMFGRRRPRRRRRRRGARGRAGGGFFAAG